MSVRSYPFVITACLLLIGLPTYAKRSKLLGSRHRTPVVSGVVFHDSNGNGLLDAREERLAGLPVSNGDTVVLTNARGYYALPVRKGQSVFPILPANYTLPTRRAVNSSFHYQQCSNAAKVDFALKKKTPKHRFTLNAIGDVQVSDHQEIEYAMRTIWPELLGKDSAEVNIFMGDLVNNNLSLLGEVDELISQLPSPSWTILGNHDRDVDSIRENQNISFNRTFGADAYAFNEGEVHFICLNNVYGLGNRGYEGRIDDAQLSFIRNDIKYVPSTRRIVLCMHIPLAFTKNASEVLNLLQGRGDVLVLSGHLHQIRRFFLHGPGVRAHELGVGAACGFWWVGEKDWQGVPSALQQQGSPRNYFVLDFDGAKYQFRYKGIGLDSRKQMSIYVTGIDSTEHHLRDFKHVDAGELIINVYGGCDSTRVFYRLDGGQWMECGKREMIDPYVARARELNLRKVYPTLFSRMNPFRNRSSQQIWTIALPEQYRTGTHTVEVKASDKFGFEASGIRSFCFPTDKASE